MTNPRTIKLNGHLIKLETAAAEKLENYLTEIRRHLTSLVDSNEVIIDLEDRLAEKLFALAHGDNQLVTLDNVNLVIEQIGNPADLVAESAVFVPNTKPEKSRWNSARSHLKLLQSRFASFIKGAVNYLLLFLSPIAVIAAVIIFGLTAELILNPYEHRFDFPYPNFSIDRHFTLLAGVGGMLLLIPLISFVVVAWIKLRQRKPLYARYILIALLIWLSLLAFFVFSLLYKRNVYPVTLMSEPFAHTLNIEDYTVFLFDTEVNRLKVSGNVALYLTYSSTPRVSVESLGYNTLWTSFYIENEELIINRRLSSPPIADFDRATVNIYISIDSIKEITVENGAQLYTTNAWVGKTLNINSLDANRIDIDVNVESLAVTSNTIGGFVIKGKAQKQEVTVARGRYLAEQLSTEQTNVSVYNGGTAYITASQELQAGQIDYGSLYYFGEPQVSSRSTRGAKPVKLREQELTKVRLPQWQLPVF